MAKYLGKKIDEVREDIIGLEVIDVEEKGRAIHLKDKKGRTYTIDFTGKDGAVVSAHSTETEEFKYMGMKLNALLEKLGIEEEELWAFME